MNLFGLIPLSGYRTIILGYLSTTIPAVLELLTARHDIDSPEFWIEVAKIMAGPLIHGFRRAAKP